MGTPTAVFCAADSLSLEFATLIELSDCDDGAGAAVATAEGSGVIGIGVGCGDDVGATDRSSAGELTPSETVEGVLEAALTGTSVDAS